MKVLIICFLWLGVLCGCSRPETLKTPAAENLRILSLVTAADHVLVQLGARDKLAAIDRHGRVLSSMQHVPVAVTGGAVSREMLHQYQINYAIIWYYQRNLEKFFRKENIPVMVVDPITPDNYSKFVNELGDLCNKNIEAENLSSKFKKAFAHKLFSGKSAKNVYIELYTPWKSPRENSYIDTVLKHAGGRLAAAGAVNGAVSPEAVALSEPEVIFFVENFGSAEEIASRPALRNSPAIKKQKIYAIPRQLLCEGVAPDEFLKFMNDKLSDD